MTADGSPGDDTHVDRVGAAPEPTRVTGAEREARAHETLERIAAGGDLSDETLQLSNSFTDEHTDRLRTWVAARVADAARLFHRRSH